MKKSIEQLRNEVCFAKSRNVISNVRITPEFVTFDVLPFGQTNEERHKRVTQLVEYLEKSFRDIKSVHVTDTAIRCGLAHRVVVRHWCSIGHNAT